MNKEEIKYVIRENKSSIAPDKYFDIIDEENFLYPSGVHSTYEVNCLDTSNKSEEYI